MRVCRDLFVVSSTILTWGGSAQCVALLQVFTDFVPTNHKLTGQTAVYLHTRLPNQSRRSHIFHVKGLQSPIPPSADIMFYSPFICLLLSLIGEVGEDAMHRPSLFVLEAHIRPLAFSPAIQATRSQVVPPTICPQHARVARCMHVLFQLWSKTIAKGGQCKTLSSLFSARGLLCEP